VDSAITFSDGVTGVIGPNGSGKSTILEAIAWALYGSPALRGTNDSVRSTASEGGARAEVALTFELGGSVYRAMRGLDGSGRAGHAVLEVDGRALRSGMKEVSEGIARLLGMDYQAFFTSFFTGQKQLEFMSDLDGRARAEAISRMLGYDRLTKARDRANEDRKGLEREIEGLEKGLPDPEELKQRAKDAHSKLDEAGKALEGAQTEHQEAAQSFEKLKPLKDASDQKAKRHEELTRRLETDGAEVTRLNSRISELRAELDDLDEKQKELDSLAKDLKHFDEAGKEFHELSELQKHEGERQRLTGQIATLKQNAKRMETRLRQLSDSEEKQSRQALLIQQAEEALAKADTTLRDLRENKVAREHGLAARITHLEAQRNEVEARKARIVQAGVDGKCPTCERPLVDELPKVLANFDSQIEQISREVSELTSQKSKSESDTSAIDTEETNRKALASELEQMRQEKSNVDALAAERQSLLKDVETRTKELDEMRGELEKLPSGFDQARYAKLREVGVNLQPVHRRSIELRTALERCSAVKRELSESVSACEVKTKEVAGSKEAMSSLAFSEDEHKKLTGEFESVFAKLNAALVVLERQRGEVNTASAILKQIDREEAAYK
ncbi:MAG: hypothetical protein A2Z18_07590, partial [Armatimonadetes bacterium RBG_16_58_9]